MSRGVDGNAFSRSRNAAHIVTLCSRALANSCLRVNAVGRASSAHEAVLFFHALHIQHLGQSQFKEFVDGLRNHVDEVDATEFVGFVRRLFLGQRLESHRQPRRVAHSRVPELDDAFEQLLFQRAGQMSQVVVHVLVHRYCARYLEQLCEYARVSTGFVRRQALQRRPHLFKCRCSIEVFCAVGSVPDLALLYVFQDAHVTAEVEVQYSVEVLLL
jgi:hypothetical protein